MSYLNITVIEADESNASEESASLPEPPPQHSATISDEEEQAVIQPVIDQQIIEPPVNEDVAGKKVTKRTKKLVSPTPVRRSNRLRSKK